VRVSAVRVNLAANINPQNELRSVAQFASRCFSLFFPKFTASDASFSAEILGFWLSGSPKNSESLAVLCRFPLFFRGNIIIELGAAAAANLQIANDRHG
jgi:hypothetical protein